MSNAFNKVRANASQTEVKDSKKRVTKVDTEITDLHEYAALKYAHKLIGTELDTLKQSVNEQAFDRFVETRSPKSFKGAEGDTSGSLQLRRRTSRSFLTDADRELLEKHDVGTKFAESSHFFIKREASENDELMGKIAEALEAADINIDDVFGHTGDKYIVAETALDDAMKIDDEDERRAVLGVVGTQAARVSFGGDHDEMLSILDDVLKG